MPAFTPKFNPFAYHEEITLTIEGLTTLGLGYGHHEGRRVEVPLVDVGETVKARVWKNHEHHAQADLLEVLSPSSNRISPKCPLFGHCSGCQYQHLGYGYQLELKRAQLKEIYKEVGIDAEPLPTASSPPRVRLPHQAHSPLQANKKRCKSR